jgi:hypothetical protein
LSHLEEQKTVKHHSLSRAQTFVSNVEAERIERQKGGRETDRARKWEMKKKGKNIRKGDRI